MVIAEGGMTHERANIHSRTCILNRRDIGCEGWKAKSFGTAQEDHRVRRIAAQSHGRCRDATVAYDHGSYSLRKLRQHRRSSDHACVVMGMNIDEARGEREAIRVNDHSRSAPEIGANFGDKAVAQSNIQKLWRMAAPIENACIPNQSVASHHVA